MEMDLSMGAAKVTASSTSDEMTVTNGAAPAVVVLFGAAPAKTSAPRSRKIFFL
jgi:hypothetical protein